MIDEAMEWCGGFLYIWQKNYVKLLYDMMDRLLKRKWIFFILLGILIIYMRGDMIILNLSYIINFFLFLIALVIAFVRIYKYDKKHKIAYGFIEIMGTLVLSFFIFLVFKIGLNFWIDKCSQYKPLTRVNVPIHNFISGSPNSMTFYFEGRKYSLKYRNKYHLAREELIDDYVLKLDLSKSVLDTYVIKNFYVVKK